MDKFISIKLAIIVVIALLNTLISLLLVDLIQGTWYQVKLTLEGTLSENGDGWREVSTPVENEWH